MVPRAKARPLVYDFYFGRKIMNFFEELNYRGDIYNPEIKKRLDNKSLIIDNSYFESDSLLIQKGKKTFLKIIRKD